MLDQRILAIGQGKNTEQAIEEAHGQGRAKGAAKKSSRKRFAFSQPRNGDGRGQYHAIKEKHLKRLDSVPQTKVVDVQEIADEMKKYVPETCRRKNRDAQPEFGEPRGLSEKNRKEEERDQELLVIKIVAVEKFRDGHRRKRPVHVAQRVKARHPAARDDPMPQNRSGHDIL